VFSWQYLNHTDAVYCAYESGEDGLLGVCDDRGELCLALSLWNGKDHILKERLFGLSGPQVSMCDHNSDNSDNVKSDNSLMTVHRAKEKLTRFLLRDDVVTYFKRYWFDLLRLCIWFQIVSDLVCNVVQGNHGEDVKELYFYRDSTPTHSYMRAEYKYPLTEFPYKMLKAENSRRSLLDSEFELLDTGRLMCMSMWNVDIMLWHVTAVYNPMAETLLPCYIHWQLLYTFSAMQLLLLSVLLKSVVESEVVKNFTRFLLHFAVAWYVRRCGTIHYLCVVDVVRCVWCWLLGCNSRICQEFSLWSPLSLYCMQSEQQCC